MLREKDEEKEDKDLKNNDYYVLGRHDGGDLIDDDDEGL